MATQAQILATGHNAAKSAGPGLTGSVCETKPIEAAGSVGVRNVDCGVQNEERGSLVCETKPMEARRASVPARPNEVSRPGPCDGEGRAGTHDLRIANRDDCAKQSQLWAGGPLGLRIGDCGLRIDGRRPATAFMGERAKQSQLEGASGSTPAPGGDPSRGRLGHMVDPSCETKPISGEGGSDARGLQRVVRNKANFACRPARLSVRHC